MDIICVPQIDYERENLALREELRLARTELRRLDQTKRDLCALTAHELRTPLAILLGYARILENEVNGPARERAEIVASHAWRIKNIIDEIILIQQMDAGELILHPDQVDLGWIIQNVVEGRKREMNEKGINLQFSSDANLFVRGDRERLALVISSLLSNAIKYSPQGAQVAIDARIVDMDVVVSIRDRGFGIPPEQQGRIFEPFHQVGDVLTRSNDGIGLGLTVAKMLVELHGGRIWLESATNNGSTFYFSLPRTTPGNGYALQGCSPDTRQVSET